MSTNKIKFMTDHEQSPKLSLCSRTLLLILSFPNCYLDEAVPKKERVRAHQCRTGTGPSRPIPQPSRPWTPWSICGCASCPSRADPSGQSIREASPRWLPPLSFPMRVLAFPVSLALSRGRYLSNFRGCPARELGGPEAPISPPSLPLHPAQVTARPSPFLGGPRIPFAACSSSRDHPFDSGSCGPSPLPVRVDPDQPEHEFSSSVASVCLLSERNPGGCRPVSSTRVAALIGKLERWLMLVLSLSLALLSLFYSRLLWSSIFRVLCTNSSVSWTGLSACLHDAYLPFPCPWAFMCID
jgi:hypothetical protein